MPHVLGEERSKIRPLPAPPGDPAAQHAPAALLPAAQLQPVALCAIPVATTADRSALRAAHWEIVVAGGRGRAKSCNRLQHEPFGAAQRKLRHVLTTIPAGVALSVSALPW